MIEEQIVLGQICLGKQGEDLVRMVKFTEPLVWYNLYGEGSCELYHTRCDDTEPYQIELEYTDSCATWKITDKDTAHPGKGQCELRYIVNGAVVKSQTYGTKVVAITDVTTDEEVTEAISDMVGQILEAKAEIEELVENLPEDFGGGGMDFIGEVETLPSEANEGDVYRVTQPIKSGKLSITVSGVQSVEENPDGMDGSLVVYLDENSPLYSFFGCVRDLQYGENEDGRTGDSYIEYNGQTYTIPWLYTTGHGDSGNGVLFASYTSDFKNIFVNGNNILCYSDTMNYIPDSLKLFDGYPEGTMFVSKNGKWEIFVESDAILESKVASVENKLANKADTTHYHTTSNITSGTLSVIRGGTGKGSWSSNRIIYPSGSTTLTQLAFPSEESVLAQKSSGSPYWKKLSDIGGGGSLAGEGGLKKIGFTADCDYVANSSDGFTAFSNAINDANNNDIIIVMPGTYTSSNALIISKNINFVGVGLPIINFAVHTDGGGEFSYEDWAWITSPYGYNTTWNGFRFKKDFTVGCEANPDNESGNGTNSAFNCIFEGTSASVIGTFENCVFDVSYFSGGHYYGSSESRFYNCKIRFSNFDRSSGYDCFVNCNFYPAPDMYMYFSTYEESLKGCKFYCVGNSFSISCSHGGQLKFNDTIFFANSVAYDDFYGNSGGHIIPLSTS